MHRTLQKELKTTPSVPSSKKEYHRLEPASDPVWMERAKRLAYLLTEPLSVRELRKRAQSCFSMTSARITNALATGDGVLFYFHAGDQKWRRYSHVEGYFHEDNNQSI